MNIVRPLIEAIRLVAVCMILSSCAGVGEIIFLQNAAGEIVQCGPYSAGLYTAVERQAAARQLRECVADYQRGGFERIPRPSQALPR